MQRSMTESRGRRADGVYDYKGNEFQIEEEQGLLYRSTPRCRITDMEVRMDEVWLPEMVEGIAGEAQQPGRIKQVYGAAYNIYSINIPYPFVGSLTMTWVTAPMSWSPWMMGLPLIPCTMPPVRAMRSSSVTVKWMLLLLLSSS